MTKTRTQIRIKQIKLIWRLELNIFVTELISICFYHLLLWLMLNIHWENESCKIGWPKLHTLPLSKYCIKHVQKSEEARPKKKLKPVQHFFSIAILTTVVMMKETMSIDILIKRFIEFLITVVKSWDCKDLIGDLS